VGRGFAGPRYGRAIGGHYGYRGDRWAHRRYWNGHAWAFYAPIYVGPSYGYYDPGYYVDPGYVDPAYADPGYVDPSYSVDPNYPQQDPNYTPQQDPNAAPVDPYAGDQPAQPAPAPDEELE
jgi:hypothetical protein